MSSNKLLTILLAIAILASLVSCVILWAGKEIFSPTTPTENTVGHEISALATQVEKLVKMVSALVESTPAPTVTATPPASGTPAPTPTPTATVTS